MNGPPPLGGPPTPHQHPFHRGPLNCEGTAVLSDTQLGQEQSLNARIEWHILTGFVFIIIILMLIMIIMINILRSINRSATMSGVELITKVPLLAPQLTQRQIPGGDSCKNPQGQEENNEKIEKKNKMKNK